MRNKTLPYAKASIATRIARGIKMPKAVYKISTKDMANELGVSLRIVRRKLSELDCIKYVGRGYSDHWEIEE